MKINIIKYESDTLMPDELHDAFDDMRKKVKDHRGELDKMEIYMQKFKNNIIMWLDDNRMISQDEDTK